MRLSALLCLVLGCAPITAKTSRLDGDSGTVLEADADTDADTDADSDADTDTDISGDCPVLWVSASDLRFHDVPVGSPELEYLTLINQCSGSGELRLTVALADETVEQYTMDPVDDALSPGDSMQVPVSFTPSSYGDSSVAGTLLITSNDPDKAAVTVVLSGSVTIDGDGDGRAAVEAGGTDCDDTDAAVHGGATEIWYDGVDQDCDSWSDFDADSDGYDSELYGTGGTDCNDDDSTVYPGADEVWYDGLDSDCEGGDDYDADGDGFEGGPTGVDCDDHSTLAYPGGDEGTVADLLDNDCDGTVDEDFVAPGSVILSEIMANSGWADDSSGEWFEVYNTSDMAIDLIGWTARDDATDEMVIDDHIVVEPGAYAVLGTGDYGSSGGVTADYLYSWGDLNLHNGGDTLYLDLGAVRITGTSWEEEHAVSGVSWALNPAHLEAAESSPMTDWCYSDVAYPCGDLGTPGEATSSCTDEPPETDVDTDTDTDTDTDSDTDADTDTDTDTDTDIDTGTSPTDDTGITPGSGRIQVEYSDIEGFIGMVRTTASSAGTTLAVHCAYVYPGAADFTGDLVAWDGVSEPDCPTSAAASPLLFEPGDYQLVGHTLASASAEPSSCASTTVTVSGPIEVEMPELGACD
jgi:hypothetical protein